jgi:hypothetical protein
MLVPTFADFGEDRGPFLELFADFLPEVPPLNFMVVTAGSVQPRRRRHQLHRGGVGEIRFASRPTSIEAALVPRL